MAGNIIPRGFGDVSAPYVGPPAELDPLASAGAEWGLASLALGGVFAVMAPPTFLLIEYVQQNDFGGFSHSDRLLAALGGSFIAALILALEGAGVGFGVVGINAARRQGRPVALGLAGLLLNALDLLIWAAAAAAWLSAVGSCAVKAGASGKRRYSCTPRAWRRRWGG